MTTPAVELAELVKRALLEYGYVEGWRVGTPREDGPLFAVIVVRHVPQGAKKSHRFAISVEDTGPEP
jgi:hypothetical protein